MCHSVSGHFIKDKEYADMEIIKAIVFVASLLILPVSGFLTVLYIVTDIVRDQQEKDERGLWT